MDPRRSPLWVFLAHPADEIAQLATDLWPPCPLARFPRPEHRESRTMPAKDGLRLNDMRRIEQARPEPGQPHHQGPVTAAQSKARRRTPQGNAELMAKEQVLGFKSARRLEEVDNEHCERMHDREHRPRSCDDSSRRCDSQAGWNFRKGQRTQVGHLAGHQSRTIRSLRSSEWRELRLDGEGLSSRHVHDLASGVGLPDAQLVNSG